MRSLDGFRLTLMIFVSFRVLCELLFAILDVVGDRGASLVDDVLRRSDLLCGSVHFLFLLVFSLALETIIYL